MSTGAAALGGTGMFRDVLEGSFPELYEPEAAEDPEPEVAAGEGADAEGDADPPAQEDADAAPREGAEGEAAQTEAPGSEAPAQEASDEYEQRIADIEEQCSSTIAGLNSLESYLDDAKTAADATEQSQLSEADALYTTRHRDAGLPRYSLALELDPSTVDGQGLLDPLAIMGENAERLTQSMAPPKTLEFLDTGLQPNYMKGTNNILHRTAMRREKHPLPPFVPRQFPGGPPLSAEEFQKRVEDSERRRRELAKTMNPGQRHLEEKVLQGMRQRLNFLRNPRHPGKSLPSLNAATEKVKKVEYTDVFAIEPPVIEFNDFEIGAVYELPVSIRNKSHISRRLRILPPASAYFSISDLRYPQQDGMLAPGLAVHATLRFSPDSLADYEDHITVVAELMRFTLDVAARRKPPTLTLDSTLDVGYVLVGNDVETRIPFKNIGGRGRFRLLADADWPQTVTPLVLPPEDVALEEGEDPNEAPVPCIEVYPFRVGPGEMDMGPLDKNLMRVGFAPTQGGEFVTQFRMVCDNCQVKTFTLVGKGAILETRVSALDGRPALPGELSRPVWFGPVVPGAELEREFTVSNATQVPLPFSWEYPEDEGVFSIEPSCGIFAAESEARFSVTFRPRAVEAYEFGVKLVVDTAFPPRHPQPGTPLVAPTVVEDFAVAGVGAARDVSLDVNLVNFAGSLLLGKQYEREVRVTNHSDSAVTFDWSGVGDGLLVYPPNGELEPAGGSVVCIVALTSHEVTRVDRNLVCRVEHGPKLPLRVLADVEGPEVAIAQSRVDFGLLQQHVAGDTYLLLRNTSSVPATWQLEERRDASAAAGGAPEVFFSVTDGELPPFGEVEVECTLQPSLPGPYRSVIACTAGGGRTSCVALRADVLQPRCALSQVEVDFGACYVGVAFEHEVTVQNMTMLPAVFRWTPECIGAGPESDAEHALDFECDWPVDEIPPGGSRRVRFLFTPRKPCAEYSALIVCDVDGAEMPLGFAVAANINGLSVGYDVCKDGRVVAGDGEDVAASAAIHDPVAVDFGDACKIREHVTMEVVIRNQTAMEVNVDLACDRFGVDDDTAVRVLECQAAATGGDSAGVGRGGVAPVGARAIGGLGGGDGMVAAAMQRATVTAEASFTSTVFGAASTIGPDGLRATLRPQPPATSRTPRDSLSGGGSASFRGARVSTAGSSASYGRSLAPRASQVSFAGSVGSYTKGGGGGGGGGGSLAPGPSGSTSSGRRPGTSGTSVSRQGGRPMLRADHERVAFSRGLGVQMDATRRAAEADAAALSTGAGAAFVVYPPSGTLPPHGEFRASVTLVSDMPGEYFDTLRCRVGDLDERSLPIRAGVVGTPLVIQSTRQKAAGYAAGHPRPTPMGLSWGPVPVGAAPSTKRFYCLNTGPRDMEIEFEPWVDPTPGDTAEAGEVRCALSTLEVDEVTGRVSVRVEGAGIMCAEEGPFRVTPSGPVIVKANGGCVGFTVEYAYASGAPREFIGSIVGKHRLAGPGGDQTKGVTLELGCAATKSRVGDEAPASTTQAISAVHPVRVRIDGGFHPSAGAPPQPMKPLVVRVEAEAFTPRLQPDAEANFAWVVHAPLDVLHSTYYRAVTLTNVWNTPVSFRLQAPKPFGVVEVESSVPQLGLEHASTLTRSPYADAKVETIPFVVPPRENLHVTMKFTPPEPDENEDGTSDRTDYVADGELIVSYDNDDEQVFPLTCEYLHPALSPSAAEMAFGKVHVNAPRLKTQRVVLTNDAEADAEWCVREALDETGFGASAFTCEPSSGIIKGKGRNGLAQSVTVEVILSPKEEGQYEAAIDFDVRMGRGCRVVCRGEGTWDETEEGKVMPRWDPLEE